MEKNFSEFIVATDNVPNAVQDRKALLEEQIKEYYLHKQLVEAILARGEIPKYLNDVKVGVAFIDLAEYSRLSKWLSPRENQQLLNGLFSAFNEVLIKRGGFLNKMEGDSFMFHFGGIIDMVSDGLSEDRRQQHCAEELFWSCIEIQEVCKKFNNADPRLLTGNEKKESEKSILRAFEIVRSLRENLSRFSKTFAMFEIQIRIGGSFGEVSMGNLGPEGKKQWDIIGQPVIEAKRMETTAPVGGLRITERLFSILNQSGITDEYLKSFRKEAKESGGAFSKITKKELFRHKNIILRDKNNAQFSSFSVMVNPLLPETVVEKIVNFMRTGEEGADEIVKTLQYYRGNRRVIDTAEAMFKQIGIFIRKEELLEIVVPQQYEKLMGTLEKRREDPINYIEQRFSLYRIFSIISNYQDQLAMLQDRRGLNDTEFGFQWNYRKSADRAKTLKSQAYKDVRASVLKRSYFYHFIMPMVFQLIKLSILEFEDKIIEELEEI